MRKKEEKRSNPLLEAINEINKVNSDVNEKEILKIYSKQYLRILVQNNLMEILKEYYICSNQKYLAGGKYIKSNLEIEPREYLKTFLYPIILSTKL